MSDDPAGHGADVRPSVTDPEARRHQAAYWRTNVRYVGLLLVVWFVVSYGFGIIFAEALNQFRIPGTGFHVGFWFAQQGSIYVFIALVWVYARWMDRIESDHGID